MAAFHRVWDRVDVGGDSRLYGGEVRFVVRMCFLRREDVMESMLIRRMKHGRDLTLFSFSFYFILFYFITFYDGSFLRGGSST